MYIIFYQPQGSNSARLFYGVLESGKRICNKISVQPILEDLKKKLFLKTNKIPVNSPSATDQHDTDVAENHTQPVNQPMIGEFLSQLDNDKGSPIRVDELEEVVDTTATVIPHVGPIEGKLLQGSDARVYALDMVRLTPRDANFVKVKC